ncbi:MAG: M14 family metallopeptidase, partial [Chloroflexota bacterium]
MRRPRLMIALVLTIFIFSSMLVGAQENRPQPDGQQGLEMYVATVDDSEVAPLRDAGYDVVHAKKVSSGTEVSMVLSPAEYEQLDSRFNLRLWQSDDGQTSTDLANAIEQDGDGVWKPFDGDDGFLTEMETIVEEYPNLVKRVDIGESVQGRPIVALKVTENANTVADNTRPAVLYISLQHAREWITGEMNLRLLRYLLDEYTAENTEIQSLLQTNEVWFVLTMNPDGYQYTFDEERFWRKNMRDNDSDGEITFNDGVDLNRNWPSERWGYDNEGSSPNITSFGYRGTEPGSEPEMQALVNLIEQIDFRFMIDYHSFGDLILYPYGWQVQTPSDDDAIFTALAGTDANPAIPAYDPGVGADLYIANGTSMDYAYDTHDILAFVIELTNGFGFVFPDDEEMIQEVFEQNLPFALDLLKSAADPAQPVSHLDSEVDDLYVDTFSVSYGDPQTVEATVARSLENINVNYQINDGEVQRMSATEWEGGERTGGDGIYYKTVRADISGASPSDTVTVFFSSNGVSSDSFTYTLVSDNDTQVLIV